MQKNSRKVKEDRIRFFVQVIIVMLALFGLLFLLTGGSGKEASGKMDDTKKNEVVAPTATPTPTVIPLPTATPVITNTPTPLPNFTVIGLHDGEKEMQAWSFVNVRDYPSKAGNKVGSLESGDIVTVTGKCRETGWCQINYNDTVAYVCTSYLVEPGSDLFSKFNPEEDINNLESYPEITYDRNWTDHEKECLAKIAMAEAEGQTLQVKTLIILTVLNRVQSPSFPDTIEEVILQKKYIGGEIVYQYFQTNPGGRYHWFEPNEDCWEAVEIAQNLKYDFSNGAMYFENSSDTSWAARNLELTAEVSGTKFYK